MGKEFTNLTEQELCDLMCGKPEDITRYCEECEYCKLGKRFAQEIVTREADGKQVLKQTSRYAIMDICVRDIDHIKEIHGWDEVCEKHGELLDMEG